jgi:hypothetical protein
MNQREREAVDAFVAQDFYEQTHRLVLGERIIFARMERDEDAPNPLKDWECNGHIYSLNRRHRNYDADAVREAMEGNPDAVALSYYEHGECLWGVAGELGKVPGVEFHFDGVEFAGVWVPDAGALENIGAVTGEERRRKLREYATGVCAAYTSYCNGECYWYSVQAYALKRDEDGTLIVEQAYYEDTQTPVVDDSCGGFLGDMEYCREEMAAAVRCAVEARGKPVVAA